MQAILPHVHHWITFHDEIEQEVHSYLMERPDTAVLIDPMYSAKERAAFNRHRQPQHVLLTNRLHYRGSARFVEMFGVDVWCHEHGMHEFSDEQAVRPFRHGDELPGGILALKVGALCPEETALLIPDAGGVMAMGDAVIREGDELEFVPDELMGDDPAGVKRGLKASLDRLLDREFDHLLLAHGEPWINGGKAALRRFLKSV